MGTRADFYIKEENSKEIEWCGSIAWDGYEIDGVEKAKTEKEFRSKLKEFLDNRDDSTYPTDGWPWPWKNSKLTDETWIFIKDKFGKGEVWRCYEKEGKFDDNTTPLICVPWNKQPEYDEGKDKYKQTEYSRKILVPDMSKISNVQLGGKKSGIILMVGK